MFEFFKWVQDKFDVLFSGLGVYVIGLLVTALLFVFFRKKLSNNRVNQNNIIAGGDVVGRDKKG